MAKKRGRPTKKSRINRAIKDKKSVSFTYHDSTGSDKGKASHRKKVNIVAAGTSKAGNGVIRGFDAYKNEYRLFREDHITNLKVSDKEFKKPKGYKKGDKGMTSIRQQINGTKKRR